MVLKPSLWLLCLLAARPVAAAAPQEQTFDAGGVKIHYLVEGRGQPVVLIHGLCSSAKINWQLPGVVGLLAKDHQVIALDLPGHGESDKPEKESAYGAQMVADVLGLLDHLKIKKAHVVGYSLGGMIAVKLIAEHQDRVLSGVIGGMGWFREGSGLQKIWQRMPAKEGGYTPAACIHSLGKLAVTREQLKAVRVPVLVLVGDRDPVKPLYVVPLESVRRTGRSSKSRTPAT